VCNFCCNGGRTLFLGTIQTSKRFPWQVEASKKAAAAAKNFKEAGSLAKEAKGLEARVSEAATEVETLKPHLQTLESTLEDLSAAAAQASDQLTKAVAEREKGRLEELKTRALHLWTARVKFDRRGRRRAAAAAAASASVAAAPSGSSSSTNGSSMGGGAGGAFSVAAAAAVNVELNLVLAELDDLSKRINDDSNWALPIEEEEEEAEGAGSESDESEEELAEPPKEEKGAAAAIEGSEGVVSEALSTEVQPALTESGGEEQLPDSSARETTDEVFGNTSNREFVVEGSPEDATSAGQSRDDGVDSSRGSLQVEEAKPPDNADVSSASGYTPVLASSAEGDLSVTHPEAIDAASDDVDAVDDAAEAAAVAKAAEAESVAAAAAAAVAKEEEEKQALGELTLEAQSLVQAVARLEAEMLAAAEAEDYEAAEVHQSALDDASAALGSFHQQSPLHAKALDAAQLAAFRDLSGGPGEAEAVE